MVCVCMCVGRCMCERVMVVCECGMVVCLVQGVSAGTCLHHIPHLDNTTAISVQYSTIHYSTVSTVQFSTQYCAVQHSTVQYSTVQ